MHNITDLQFRFSSLSSNAFALFQVNHPFISYFMPACCSDNWQYTWAFMSKALTSYQCNDNNFYQAFLFFLLYSEQNVFYMAPCPRVLTTESFRSLSSVINPSLASPPPNHVPKCHIYISLKYPQGWWFSCFPGQLLPVLGNPLGVKSW